MSKLSCSGSSGRHSRPIDRGIRPLFATLSLVAATAAPSLSANYYELNGPVRTGSSSQGWMGKGSPLHRGAFDVAAGTYFFEHPIVTLRGRQPFALSWLHTSQTSGPGPMGIGSSLSCDFFVARSPIVAGQPYVLIAPGNRQFLFDTAPNGNGDYINTRDPEMLGAVLDLTGTPPSLASTLRYKDGRRLYFSAAGACTKIEDRHGNAVTITRDSQDRATQVTVSSSRYLTFAYNATSGKLEKITATYGTGTNPYRLYWYVSYNASGYLYQLQGPTTVGTAPNGPI